MIDVKKHEYEQKEYEQFLGYVKSTWGSLFDTDFRNEVKIRKIIISAQNNSFDVFVFIEENVYVDYDFETRILSDVPCGDKPIKTHYTLDSFVVLYMLLNGNLVNDLGLNDVEFVVFDFANFKIDEDLTKKLESFEQDYAETLYCIEHDL